MAFVAADVTYTVLYEGRDQRSHKMVIAKLAFGDGVKTYSTGGVPISGASLGCPNVIEALIPFGNDASTVGYDFIFDRTNSNLILLQSPAQTHSHDLSFKNAAVADGATTRLNAGTNLLGANTGSDITVAGGGANGGVVSKTLAAASQTEPNTVAIAAQAVYVLVIGW